MHHQTGPIVQTQLHFGHLTGKDVYMNTEQLDCFLEAAKCKSFSIAASHLFVSQPTLSRNIATLEKELEAQPFSIGWKTTSDSDAITMFRHVWHTLECFPLLRSHIIF